MEKSVKRQTNFSRQALILGGGVPALVAVFMAGPGAEALKATILPGTASWNGNEWVCQPAGNHNLYDESA